MYHVKLILIKGVLTILSITVLYYKQVTKILSIAVHILGVILHSNPPFSSMSTSSCSGCWVVTVWLLSTPVFVVVIISVATRVLSHPSMGSKGPLCMGGSILHQGCRHLLIPLPNMEGYLPATPPKFGLANCDPVPWVGTSVSRSTIQCHLWAATSFPQPNSCVPLDVNSHVTLPVVLTHLLWMLQWISMVEVITSH